MCLDVLDVYLIEQSQTVLLVDFNPFHPITDSKLFDWHELETLSSPDGIPVFRCVQSSEDIHPSPNYMQAFPEDLLQLHSRTQQATLEELLDNILGKRDPWVVDREDPNLGLQ
jgi:hypothetical protein